VTAILPFTDSPIIENGAYFDLSVGSTTPTLMSIGQASGIVIATVRPPDIITDPITTFTLYRSIVATGPWTMVDTRSPSPTSRWANLMDATPLYDTRAYYFATTDGPLQSNAMYFIANATPSPIAPGGTLSTGAFGPNPIHGSDPYLDGNFGEAVIGPNGDLLAVNGLPLLAQDLRTRITTEQGELLLHLDFGQNRERLIGSGQSNPAAQAQILRARFIDIILQDPRIYSIESLSIVRVSLDAWTIDVTFIGIGSEDAQRLNIVFPYFEQST
jgi:hypothetical protein